jgi:two-component system OmpR family response regulator
MSTVGTATVIDALASLSDVPVAIVRWPEEIDRDCTLAREGRLRLLLVAPTAAPPPEWDAVTDWIRLPAADEDIWSRVAGLRRRVRRLPLPRLDEHGLVWRGASWVGLSPTEARLFAVLLDKPGTVCSRDSLARCASPDGVTGARSVDVYIKRLRRRIVPLGLAIRTVRQRGFFLEIDPQSRVR